MATGVGIWGLGFAATNSMQQVRLVGADPSLGQRHGLAQHLGALYRPGGRLGDRRRAVRGRLSAPDGYVSMAFIALALTARW